MWYVAYNAGLLLALPFILLILLSKKRCRRGLSQRLGRLPPRLNPDGRGVLWVHAVSLGEVVAVVPLVRELHARYPRFRIIVSTVTETGREAVEQRLSGVAEHCYAPLDFSWVVTRVVDQLHPSLFLFVETELWPNLLRALAQRHVGAVLVNGRLSSRSFGRYRLIKPLMAKVMSGVSRFLMQSERDAERIIALGANPERVVRTGNIKFDQPLPDLGETSKALPRDMLGLAGHEEILVAGSTHPGEEQELLTCYDLLHREFKSLVLLMAPRHIERAAEVERAVREYGFLTVRRSELANHKAGSSPTQGPRVVILDTRGELLGAYRHAAVAFVGGTLIPVGGHNLLEPAMWGKPVLFGPYTDHCAETAELLIRAGGAKRIQNGKDLAHEVGRLFRDRVVLERTGQAARTVVTDNRGAVQRCLEQLGGLLDGSEISRPQTSPACQPSQALGKRALKGER